MDPAEREADLLALSENSPKRWDSSLQKKHESMLQRLSNRESRSQSTVAATASFLTQFSNLKSAIECKLQESSGLSSNETLLKSHMADISASISSLEQFVATNSYSLPAYECRSALETVSSLRRTLENLSSQFLPKKKFSFRNKSTTPHPSPEPPRIREETEKAPQSLTIQDSPGFRNKEGENLTMSFKESGVMEFTLSDLNSCEVRLVGCLSSLFISRLKSCKVYTGPVMGSVLIDDTKDCVFMLAAHQVRIHGAKRSDFYLRLRSRPIIEDCSSLRFAPFCLSYKRMEDDLRTAGLQEDNSHWREVDDFKWLRSVQSPNWSVIDEKERTGNVEIVDYENG